MARAPINVLIVPYRIIDHGVYEYAILKRADKGVYGGIWQFISGGAEDEETAEDAFKRETFEESGIPSDSKFYRLDCFFTVPRFNFPVGDKIWPNNLYMVPNYCYAVDASGTEIIISNEHSEYKWCSYEECYDTLFFLSNKCALWELNERLLKEDMLIL